VAFFGVSAFAKSDTVKGQLVDQACYLKDPVNNKGVDHKMPKDTKDCAIACAKAGQPMALLTSDGKVVTIKGGLAANKNAKLVPFVGQMVEITGDVTDTNGKMSVTADDIKVSK
jgi:hypothetical protein